MVGIKTLFFTDTFSKFWRKYFLTCFLTTLRNCTPHFGISFLSLLRPSRNYLLCASRQCPLLLFPSRRGSVPKKFVHMEKIIVLNKDRALFWKNESVTLKVATSSLIPSKEDFRVFRKSFFCFSRNSEVCLN